MARSLPGEVAETPAEVPEVRDPEQGGEELPAAALPEPSSGAERSSAQDETPQAQGSQPKAERRSEKESGQSAPMPMQRKGFSTVSSRLARAVRAATSGKDWASRKSRRGTAWQPRRLDRRSSFPRRTARARHVRSTQKCQSTSVQAGEKARHERANGKI